MLDLIGSLLFDGKFYVALVLAWVIFGWQAAAIAFGSALVLHLLNVVGKTFIFWRRIKHQAD